MSDLSTSPAVFTTILSSSFADTEPGSSFSLGPDIYSQQPLEECDEPITLSEINVS